MGYTGLVILVGVKGKYFGKFERKRLFECPKL
jgi:hypothetical protein